MKNYIIKAGDTLYQIATRFGVSINDLLAANTSITSPNKINVGDVINIPIAIPAGPIVYTLQYKDTLYGISMRLGVSIQQILDANPNINPLNLIPGTNISIPLVDYSDGTKKIYNILGSTTVLSQQQTDNITRWRYNIIKLANDNPDSIIINGPILEKQVCLTFDDGADLVITPKVLDLLNKYNVKASFFFTGHNVDKYKDVAIRANQEGHSLLSHSYYHPNFAKEGLDYIKREILMTEDRFSQVIGKRPAIIRPPFGSIDDRVLSAFRETNNKAVIWSIDSMDWAQNISKDNIIRNVLNNVRPGDIVLMHSYSTLNLILEALPIIILGLKNKGYKLVDIGELLNIPIYK